MDHNAVVYFSNAFEELAKKLEENLFPENHDPFLNRIVITPSAIYKNWLLEFFIKKQKRDAISGIRFLHLQEAVVFLRKKAGLKVLPLPSNLKIQLFLQKSFQNNQLLKGSSLSNFLQKDAEARVQELSSQLSQLFRIYPQFFPEKMKVDSESCWQERCWNEVMFQQKLIEPYLQLLEPLNFPNSFEAQVYCFGFDFIPPTYFSFFSLLSKNIPVHHYLFSPTNIYWQDLCSDQQTAFIQKKLRKKELSKETLVQIDGYFSDRNSLLANWGKLGQKYLDILDQFVIEPEDLYASSEDKTTFLGQIAADLFHMQSPEKKDILLSESDDSIQIHACPSSKLREVQILRENLKYWIGEMNIAPSEIFVMAPNIEQYYPYIHFAFREGDCSLEYKIHGMSLTSENSYSNAFLTLLSLVGSKWSVDTVFTLFLNPAFQRRTNLKTEDLQILFDWIEQAKIQWGLDENHQSKFIRKDAANRAETWEYALEQILMGLVYRSEDPLEVPIAYPISGIELSQVDIFDNFLEVFYSLKSAISQIEKCDTCSLYQWAEILSKLSDEFLWVGSSSEEKGAEIALNRSISHLKELSHQIDSEVQFDVVHEYISQELSQKTGSIHTNSLDAVQFCSINSENVIPSQAIYLLGMQEESFFDPMQSIHLLYKNRNQLHFPTAQEKKRYGLLKAIFSAKRFFWVSYQHLSAQDGKAIFPSLFVQELLSYLDRSYRITGSLPSEIIERKHPCYDFQKEYFSEHFGLKNYSESSFELSKIYYAKDSKQPSEKLTFSYPKEDIPVSSSSIPLSELAALSRHPLKFYCQKSLGVYLDYEQQKGLDLSEFQLDGLDRYLSRQQLMSTSLQEVLHRQQKQKRLPKGVFNQVARLQIEEQDLEIIKSLESAGIKKTDIQSIFLTPSCKSALQTAEGWTLPALTITLDDAEVSITGTIPFVSPSGIVFACDDKPVNLIKSWPVLLVYLHIAEPLGLPRKALLLKAKQIEMQANFDHENYLQKFMRYYFLSKERPSLLMAEWSDIFQNGEVKDLQKAISKSIENNGFTQPDMYLRWVFERAKVIDLEAAFGDWSSLHKDLFAPLLDVEEMV